MSDLLLCREVSNLADANPDPLVFRGKLQPQPGFVILHKFDSTRDSSLWIA